MLQVYNKKPGEFPREMKMRIAKRGAKPYNSLDKTWHTSDVVRGARHDAGGT